LSTPSNIVEGCARHSLGDYLRFLDHAHGSARELKYQLSVAQRLGYLSPESGQQLAQESHEVCVVLNALIVALRRKTE
jgi:four helix bundle protein